VELESAIESSDLQVIGERGVVYNPFADRWQLSSDMDVNYMLVAQRQKKQERSK
jgi:2-polyprenyl-6-hydroxyphenyl methylase/3-demethylubiquinone-9 3-methyltransferase